MCVGVYTHLSPYPQAKSDHTYVIFILCVHVGVYIHMHTLPVYAFLIWPHIDNTWIYGLFSHNTYNRHSQVVWSLFSPFWTHSLRDKATQTLSFVPGNPILEGRSLAPGFILVCWLILTQVLLYCWSLAEWDSQSMSKISVWSEPGVGGALLAPLLDSPPQTLSKDSGAIM